MENQNDSSTIRPWADLPEDILRMIFRRLPLVSYLRAATVCKSWASIPKSTRSTLPRPQLPWLMLQKRGVLGRPRNINYCDFFSPLDNKSFRFDGLWFDETKLCHGSSHGWLVTVQEGLTVVNENRNPPAHIIDCKVYLFNPFSKAKIDLPPLSRCPVPLYPQAFFKIYIPKRQEPTFIKKVTMSCTPTARGCVIVVLTSFNNVAFCRPGDYFWRVIDGSLINVSPTDLAFCKGNLYLLDIMDKVWYCSDDLYTVAGSAPANRQARLQLLGTLSLPPPGAGIITSWRYLVESKGELLLLVREIGLHNTHYFLETKQFKIYQFVDPSRCISLREEMSVNLEDQMLFLSKNHKESCTASEEFTRSYSRKFRGNRIYFTPEFFLEPPDYGFYSMEDRSVGQFLPSDVLHDIKSLDAPIWVSPIPWYV